MTIPSSNLHPYQGPARRIVMYALRATLILFIGGIILAPLTYASFRTPGAADALPVSLVGFGLLLLLVWQTMLTFAHIAMLRVSYRTDDDVLTLLRGDDTFLQIPYQHIQMDEAAEVVYRQGKPIREGGSVLRPRRRFQRALFVPVTTQPEGPLTAMALRSIARMYAGRRARHGIIITPDHAQHEALITTLEARATA